jgi:hypothetical protein
MQEKSLYILKLKHIVGLAQSIHEIARGEKSVALLISNTTTT